MVAIWARRQGRAKGGTSQRGFTLIELLVVMSIISLLIAILLPSLSGARTRAKVVKTQSILHSIEAGLELYRNDNTDVRLIKKTNGYPPSAMAEDPAVSGYQEIAGANWLLRHLMGKDLNGYAPRASAPGVMQNPGDPDEQVTWYQYNPDGTPVVERMSPFVSGLEVVRTQDLPQGEPNFAVNRTYEEQVFVDTFGFPILYYVANSVVASRPKPYLASYSGSNPSGVFTYRDNGLFTGQCQGSSCNLPSWNFGASTTLVHDIENFGPNPPDPGTIGADVKTFQYYIMDKSLYDATFDLAVPANITAIPHRRDSFLLITPGKDGLYGTRDDVKNF